MALKFPALKPVEWETVRTKEAASRYKEIVKIIKDEDVHRAFSKDYRGAIKERCLTLYGEGRSVVNHDYFVYSADRLVWINHNKGMDPVPREREWTEEEKVARPFSPVYATYFYNTAILEQEAVPEGTSTKRNLTFTFDFDPAASQNTEGQVKEMIANAVSDALKHAEDETAKAKGKIEGLDEKFKKIESKKNELVRMFLRLRETEAELARKNDILAQEKDLLAKKEEEFAKEKDDLQRIRQDNDGQLKELAKRQLELTSLQQNAQIFANERGKRPREELTSPLHPGTAAVALPGLSVAGDGPSAKRARLNDEHHASEAGTNTAEESVNTKVAALAAELKRKTEQVSALAAELEKEISNVHARDGEEDIASAPPQDQTELQSHLVLR